MMKKVLKGLGVLAVGGLAIGIIIYFQSLKIDGDPLLKTCWAVDIYDDVTGEKVVGAEDLDFDPETGTIFVSAYDRRAVAREIDAGEVTTQGGIYTFQVSDITGEGTLNVTDISRGFKEAGNEFRPHGFAFISNSDMARLVTINRVIEYKEKDTIVAPVFDFFSYKTMNWEYEKTANIQDVCDPNDVIFTESMLNEIIVYTDIHGHCGGGFLNHEGAAKTMAEGSQNIAIPDLAFPNGLVETNKFLAISQSSDKSIAIFPYENEAERITIRLPIAPDNLTVDEKDNLYLTGFPSLIDYYFYIKNWLGVKKSPSAAYRISPDDYAQELLFKDDGTMISGATVALRAGDYLILGSGWDDNIAICSGMDRLD